MVELTKAWQIFDNYKIQDKELEQFKIPSDGYTAINKKIVQMIISYLFNEQAYVIYHPYLFSYTNDTQPTQISQIKNELKHGKFILTTCFINNNWKLTIISVCIWLYLGVFGCI